MATTLATIARSTYKVGIEQVQMDLRASTPASGSARRGWGEWHLFDDGGEYVRSVWNVLDFAWPLLPGWQVMYRWAGFSGDVGQWELLTSLATEDWDMVQHVDPTLGSNANDGLTTGTPVQTIAQALTNAAPAMVTGASVKIALKRGETFAAGTGQVWAGSSVDFRIVFGDYGSGAKPAITCGSSSGTALFGLGARSHVVLWNLHAEATNDQTSGGNVLLAYTTGREHDVAIDSGLYNVTTDGLATYLYGTDGNVVPTDKASGACDFFFVYGSENQNPKQGTWQWWGMHYLRYIALIDSTINYVPAITGNGLQRNYQWTDLFAHHYTLNCEDANPWRLYGGNDANTAHQRMSFDHVVHIQKGLSYAPEIRFAAGGADSIIRDVRFHACTITHTTSGVGSIGISLNEDNMERVRTIQDFDIWNSLMDWPTWQHYADTTPDLASLSYIGNAPLAHDNSGFSTSALGFFDIRKIQDGALTLHSNLCWWPNKNQSQGFMSQWSNGTPEAFAAKFAECDYNVQISKNLSHTALPTPRMRWWPDDSNPAPRYDYTYLRSEVCTTQSRDCNSFEAGPAAFDGVHDGTGAPALFDPRPVAGTGAQVGRGKPQAYAIDADGNVRDPDAPTAGPYEWAGTALEIPELPSPAPGSPNTMRRRGGLRLSCTLGL